ncbi:MAG: hypothetical protein NUW14_07280 [Deltaproteobacteria bacterium]|nr:hypothetical protein [Deltaproteobacteria bacterium]
MKCFAAVALSAALSLYPCASVLALSLHGFVEGAGGFRLKDDPAHVRDATMGEGRLQVELSQVGPADSRLFFKADLIGDGVEERGDADLREFYLDVSPAPVIDIRAGRQILTWGTGDLIFINDLFPKDFVSFFIGRSLEYLKVGSDAVKFSLYPGPFSLDLVAVPHFTPSEVPQGERLSFFNPFTDRIAAPDESLSMRKPAATTANTELALRLYRTFGSYEGALYGFRGFFKEPVGMDPADGTLFYPKLSVYGASMRGPFLQGVASIESGYYDSREDRPGTNPLIENSSLRYLLGYEREIWTDFTVRAQYYLEQMLESGAYKASLPPGAPEKKEVRHLLFLRLTQLLRYQTVELSLVGFYGPSDEDGMVNPQVSCKITDRLSIALGANVFFGKKDFTQFGQLERDDNLYLRLRASY